MDQTIASVLRDLEEFASTHTDTWNITPDTGQFLNILIRAIGARRVLEVGCSNGYSSIWMAEALRESGGSLTTLEFSEERAARARENFQRAGVSNAIQLIEGDARQTLETLQGPFDLVFLDAWKEDNPFYAEAAVRLLRAGGLILADNATSHPEDMKPYRDLVESHPQLRSVLVPIGKGEELSIKL